MKEDFSSYDISVIDCSQGRAPISNLVTISHSPNVATPEICQFKTRSRRIVRVSSRLIKEHF